MGYDVMAAWEKRSFEFNDSIQERYVTFSRTSTTLTACRGGPYQGRIPWDSSPGRSISQDTYEPPSFTRTTSRWSPPATPTSPTSPKHMFPVSRSPRQVSASSSPKRSRSPTPRADSALSGATITPPPDQKSLAKKLYAAAAAGDVQHMRLLVSLGAPIDAATVVPDLYEAFKPAKPGHLSALAGAASFGHLEAVEYLLSLGANISPDLSISTSSPLQQACRANDIDMANYLLQHGADINQRNYYKSTPLMYAVKYGSTELVNLIISYGPDFNAQSFMGSSATHWAIWPGRLNMLELLLRAGANPNDMLADESTLLHCASLSGWVEGVKLLVRYNADVFRRDQHWRTPLDIAVLNQHPDVVEVLKAAMLLAS